MATVVKSRRRFLIGAAEAAAVAGLGYFGIKRLLDQREGAGAKLKVIFLLASDGLGTDGITSHPGGLWDPVVSGSDVQEFTLRAVSAELANYKRQSLYLTKLIVGPGNTGHNGARYVLRDSAASHSSVDTILGQVMPGLNTTERVLYATPHNDGHDYGRFSWTNASARPIEANPKVLYDRIFGSSALARSGIGGSQLLDLAHEDINELQQRLGAGSQRAKLDEQLDAVEQLSADLEEMEGGPGPAPGCTHESPESVPHMSSQYRNQATLAHFKLVASALSCGLMRVATLPMGRSSDQINLPETQGLPGISSRNPHDLSHRYGNASEWENSRRWYARQARLLLDELSARPDPDVSGDNLLQHTLVIFTSEMSDGAPEHSYNMPVVLIGGASGRLQSGSSGRVLNLSSQADQEHWAGGPSVSMQRLWSTLAQLADTAVPYAGNKTPLSGIFNV